jgi:phage terminase large subunit-like protein
MATIEPLARDPVAFIEQVLVNPETGTPFKLHRAQRRFLAQCLATTPDGRLRFPELLFSAPKKSGKTGFAAMLTLFVVLVLGGPYAEAYCVANDFEQAQGRVFAAIARIVEASPLLRATASISANKITSPLPARPLPPLPPTMPELLVPIRPSSCLTSCGAMPRSVRTVCGTKWSRWRHGKYRCG